MGQRLFCGLLASDQAQLVLIQGGYVETAYWEESLPHANSKVSIDCLVQCCLVCAKIVMNSMVTGKQ